MRRVVLILSALLLTAAALPLVRLGSARAADADPTEQALTPVRGNFTKVWAFDNARQAWTSYDPTAQQNSLTGFERGQPYIISGVQRQAAAFLGGAQVTLYPGDNYIVWGVPQQPIASTPLGHALHAGLGGKIGSAWLFDGPTQAWYGYDASYPFAYQGIQWLAPGYAYWLLGVPERTQIDIGGVKTTIYPGANLIGWSEPAPAARVAPTLPNLAPYQPKDWDSPLVLSTQRNPTRNGPLSARASTYLSFAIANNGGVAPTKPVRTTLQVDGRPLSFEWSSDPQNLTPKRFRWLVTTDPLESLTRITPGKHVVTMVIDPLNEVEESDKTDNRFEREFTWVDSPVDTTPPTPAPLRELRLQPFTLPQPGSPLPARANLRASWPDAWAGPIVFSSEREDFSGAKPVPLSGPVYLALAFENGGSAAAANSFDVQLTLDGKPLISFTSAAGMSAGSWRSRFGIDFRAAYQANIDPGGLSDGRHTLRMVLDPGNAVDERTKDDNVYESTFTVTNGVIAAAPKRTATPVYLTTEQIRAKIAKYTPLLSLAAPTVSEDGKSSYVPDVLDVSDGLYYLLTGRTLQQERDEYNLTILIETRAQWAAATEADCNAQYWRTPPERYTDVFTSCHRRLTDFIGLNQSPERGRPPTIQVRGDLAPRSVVVSLMHELGHYHQWALQPDLAPSRTVSQNAMHEIQAHAMEAASTRLLEELTGINLATAEQVESWLSVDSVFDRIVSLKDTEEHNRAYLAVWGAVLNDPALFLLRWKLTTFGYLDAQGNLDLYNYLVNIPWREWASRVDGYLLNLDATIASAKAIVRQRMVYNLPPTQRPTADFSKVAFNLP